MKVLFAVSNESISEGIVKQYQKEYKEILSYKNVYYFNAILKEIQKDKTYDRIIISEELEPFSNNNYEQIDKFLFEKLDNISDEAQDSNGQETSIIFICTDRRAKGSNFLVKLFSIGVYNALLGQDRVKAEVCRLINKPRIKKEAKLYYGIDADGAQYDQSSDSEVTELEINNIRNHFKKLGKNTEKYAESFNNIAVQYNDEQLRIIVNCLPINVKAVLEANSPRYQELMNASAGKIRSVAGQELEMQAKESGIKMDLIQNAKSNIERPIVIPSSVKRRTTPSQPIQNQPQSTGTVKRTVVTNSTARTGVTQSPVQPQAPVRPQVPNVPQAPVVSNDVEDDIFNGIDDMLNDEILGGSGVVPNVEEPVVNDLSNDTFDIPGLDDNFDTGLDDLLGGTEDVVEEVPAPGVNQTPVTENVADDDFGMPGLDDFGLDDDSNNVDDLLPGLDLEDNDDLITNNPVVPTTNNVVEDNVLSGFEEEDSSLDDLLGSNDEEDDAPVKKGRGRPRKLVTEPPKPKGKRGRPRKVVSPDGTELPGMEYDDEDEYTDEVSLPGLDELDDFDIFGGDDTFGGTSTDDSILPGLDDLDDINPSVNTNVTSATESSSLPGLENDNILPGFDNLDSDLIPSNNNDLDGILPGFGDDDLDGVLPGFDDSSTLPGMDFDNNALPGLDDDSADLFGGSLPGFEDDDLMPSFDEPVIQTPVSNEPVMNTNMNNNMMNNNTTAIESIKSNIDYSMSTLNSLLTKENKIVTFIGTTKNGTSFLVNNLGLLFDSLGINTAILDMTKNRNSYYIYTNSDEELRNISANAMENLERGVAKGIRVKENLTVYTAIPDNGKVYNNAESILSTLVQNHSLVLIDCDYDTDPSYFASCQEIYLVQSMDVLTIQPLTAFLKGLKTKGVLEPEKIRIAINKHVRLKEFSAKDFIAGMSCYNDPSMSIMTELFNREMVKFCIIDFEEGVYAKYLDSMASCKVNLNGYSKSFITNLRKLGDMVYPLTGGSKQAYGNKVGGGTSPVGYAPKGGFSSTTSSTLDKMRKKY